MRLLQLFFYSFGIVSILAFSVAKYDDYRRKKIDIRLATTDLGHVLALEDGELLYTISNHKHTKCETNCHNSFQIFYSDIKRVHSNLLISDFSIINLPDGSKQVFFKNKPLFIKSKVLQNENNSHLSSHWVLLNNDSDKQLAGY